MSPNEIATLSLLVSGLTAWFTLVRRGRVRMTRPAIVAFAAEEGKAKVLLRFLLYSTAQRGNIVEALYVVLRQGDTKTLFSFWGCGTDTLVRGSGMFVGREGVATNHHFVRPSSEATVPVLIGECVLSVYASILGERTDRLLGEVRLAFTNDDAAAINDPNVGVLYDWHPHERAYRGEPRRRSGRAFHPELSAR